MLNRAVARLKLFEKQDDDEEFERVLAEAIEDWSETASRSTAQPPTTTTRSTRSSRSRSRRTSSSASGTPPPETVTANQDQELARQRRIDHILDLHEVILLDPNGPSGKEARKRLIDLSKPRRSPRR